MNVLFEEGATYNRRRDIHEKFGGQRQGGISTPDGQPFVFLFTGELGNTYGYADGWDAEGVFHYTGEGQIGDMQFLRGNRAIRDHALEGRDLLLFEKLGARGQYRFVGIFGCAGWSEKKAPDRQKAIRKAIIFQLVPMRDDLAQGNAAELPNPMPVSLSDLRLNAYRAAQFPAQPGFEAKRTFYSRSRAVRDYVLARANGSCEACGCPAPFLRRDGSPYLEPHHTRRVSDGGPDHPRWVGAICPTCHREIHHGAEGDLLNRKLVVRLGKKEPTDSIPISAISTEP